MAAAQDAPRSLRPGAAARARAERVFFGAMAAYCAVTTLGGFVPTFFLRETFLPGAAPLAPIIVLHGGLFTVWIVLFVAQTALIAANRRELHRKLGAGALLAIPAAVAIGLPMIAVFEGSHGAEPPRTLTVHLLANVAPLTLFAGFAAAGFLWRASAPVHKRLMLFATLALQPAGFARLIGYLGVGPALNVPAYGALCGACVLYDLGVERRVRWVTALGAGLLFAEVYVTDRLFAVI